MSHTGWNVCTHDLKPWTHTHAHMIDIKSQRSLKASLLSPLLSHHCHFHFHVFSIPVSCSKDTGQIKTRGQHQTINCTQGNPQKEIQIHWPKLIYSEENFLFLNSVVFNSLLFWVKRALRAMWWEEVYRSTSVCKSGRFCCQNTVNSPLHQLQHNPEDMLYVDWLSHVLPHWSAPELLFVSYNEI